MAQHKALKDAIREKEIRKRLMDTMKQQYQRGLLNGSRAMLKVIGDKIAEKDKTTEEKLTEVMKLINNMLAMTDKTAKEAEQLVDVVEGTGEGLDNVIELPIPPEEEEPEAEE